MPHHPCTDRISYLVELCSREPSQELFTQIIELFSSWQDETTLEQALQHAEAKMRHWDDHLRCTYLKDCWPEYPEGQPKPFSTLLRWFSRNRQSDKSHKGIQTLVTSEIFKNLTRLSLSDCDLGPDALSILSQAKYFHRLTELDLSANPIQPLNQVCSWDFIGAMPNLQRLCLGNSGLDSKGLHTMLSAPNAKNISSLVLYTSRLYDEGPEIIASSPNMVHLEELDLSGCHIGPKGFKALIESSVLNNLRKLKLVSNKIGNKGMEYLASHSLPPSLTQLHLGKNNIDDEGAFYITKNKSLLQLKELTLYFNKIGATGKSELNKNINLGNIKIDLDEPY